MSSPEQLIACKEQKVCKEREAQEEQEDRQEQDFRNRIEVTEVESDHDNSALQVPDKSKRQSPEIPSVSACVECDTTNNIASDETKVPHLQFTVPEPFKFHETRTHCKQSLEQKSPYVPLAARLRELVEKTPERFKSHVVSKQSHHFHQIPLTRPKPFTLQTAIRGEHYKDLFQQRIEQLRLREKENQFRATPLPNLDPDIPRKPELRPPTEPVDFYFLTEERIKHHKLMEQERKQREEDYDNLRLKKLKDDERRKERELRRLRKDRVLRARPIMKYRPIIIMPSKKKLTKAKSPMIGDKRKRHMQYLQESASNSLNGSRSVSAMSLHSEQ
ncbi:6206_t:CDS:2 [Paraglomus occultum]|uniref:6206_t:CDS:1 n=1 Tax=Paraglomus occultum TaxID=144539 RepID=A0A9N8Z042_9GLOM|nr:6206_t:CDS:2 [Paraglomus occultum]